MVPGSLCGWDPGCGIYQEVCVESLLCCCRVCVGGISAMVQGACVGGPLAVVYTRKSVWNHCCVAVESVWVGSQLWCREPVWNHCCLLP